MKGKIDFFNLLARLFAFSLSKTSLFIQNEKEQWPNEKNECMHQEFNLTDPKMAE